MPNVRPIDSTAARRVRAAGTVVATLCVLGLVGIVWLHAGGRRGIDAAADTAPPVAAARTHDFLHAPATVSTVPSAESVFGATPSAIPADENPPTF